MSTPEDEPSLTAETPEEEVEVVVEDASPETGDERSSSPTKARISKTFKKSLKTLKKKSTNLKKTIASKKGKSKAAEGEENPVEETPEPNSEDVEAESPSVEDEQGESEPGPIPAIMDRSTEVKELQDNILQLQDDNALLIRQVELLNKENDVYKMDPENQKTHMDAQQMRIAVLEAEAAKWKRIVLDNDGIGPSKAEEMESQYDDASTLLGETQSTTSGGHQERIQLLEGQSRENVKVLKASQKKILEHHERAFNLKAEVMDLKSQIGGLNEEIENYKASIKFFETQLYEEEKQTMALQKDLDMEKDKVASVHQERENERILKEKELEEQSGGFMPCWTSSYQSQQQTPARLEGQSVTQEVEAQ